MRNDLLTPSKGSEASDQARQTVDQSPARSSIDSKRKKIRRRIRRLFLWALLPILLLLALFYFYHVPLLRSAARFLVYESTPKPCELVVVLGGGRTDRVEKAVELLQNGYAREILMMLPERIPPDAAYGDLLDMERRMCRSVLELRGVAPDKIHWSSEAFYSTYDEIKSLRAWMREKGIPSAIIIPGLFQSRRARWTVDHLFKGTKLDVLVIPAPHPYVSATDWWSHEEGIVTVENEYIKNIYYQLKSLVGEP